ncbi:MAG: hypothetical protein WBO70_05840 [Erysipelotrichaceae bacterium]
MEKDLERLQQLTNMDSLTKLISGIYRKGIIQYNFSHNNINKVLGIINSFDKEDKYRLTKSIYLLKELINFNAVHNICDINEVVEVDNILKWDIYLMIHEIKREDVWMEKTQAYRVYEECGRLLAICGEYEEAISQLEIASKINPVSDDVYRYLGLCYSEIKDDSNFIKISEKWRTIMVDLSDSIMYFRYRILGYINLENYELANVYNEALKIYAYHLHDEDGNEVAKEYHHFLEKHLEYRNYDVDELMVKLSKENDYLFINKEINDYLTFVHDNESTDRIDEELKNIFIDNEKIRKAILMIEDNLNKNYDA